MKCILLIFLFIFLHFCSSNEHYDVHFLANQTLHALKKLSVDYNDNLLRRLMDYSISQCASSNKKPIEIAAIITSIYPDYCSVATALLYYTNEWCINNDSKPRMHRNLFNRNVIQTYDRLSTQSDTLNILRVNQKIEVETRLELIRLATVLNPIISNSSLTTNEYASTATILRDDYFVKYKTYEFEKLLSKISEKYFKVLQVERFIHIDNILNHLYPNTTIILTNFLSNLTEIVSGLNIPFVNVYGRVKSHYSIFTKTISLHKRVDQLNDNVGARIVLEKENDCFTVLKACHDSFEFDPSFENDYITYPKPNGYQSLHTTLFTEDKRKVELQIRTKEMDDFGRFTHLQYKKSLLMLLNANFFEEFQKVEYMLSWQ